MSDARWGSSSVEKEDASGTLSVGDQCDLLTSDRRRHILRYLISYAEDPVRTDDLVTYLRDIEHTADTRHIRHVVHHIHLPKLSQKGIITYDADEGRIEYRPHEGLENLLAFLEER